MIGDTTLNGANNVNGNFICAITASESGILTSIGLNVAVASGNLETAIYSTDTGTVIEGLLGQSASTPAVAGWNDLPIPGGVPIVAGTTYYIAFECDDNVLAVYYEVGIGSFYAGLSDSYGTFSDPTGTYVGVAPSSFNMRINYSQAWTQNLTENIVIQPFLLRKTFLKRQQIEKVVFSSILRKKMRSKRSWVETISSIQDSLKKTVRFKRRWTENAVSTDVLTRYARSKRSWVENVSSQDISKRIVNLKRTWTENIISTNSLKRLMRYKRLLTQNLSIQDIFGYASKIATHPILKSIRENFSRMVVYHRPLPESVIVQETLTYSRVKIIRKFVNAIIENLSSISDNLNRKIVMKRLQTEKTAIQAVFNRQKVYKRFQTEKLLIKDQATRSISYVRNFIENIAAFLPISIAVTVTDYSVPGAIPGKDALGSNTIESAYVVASMTGILNSIGLNVSSAIGNLRLAIYSSTSGDTLNGLLGQSDSTPMVTGWNDLPIPGGVQVVAGNTYIIAFLTDSDGVTYYSVYDIFGGYVDFSVTAPYGPFPDPTNVYNETVGEGIDMRMNYTLTGTSITGSLFARIVKYLRVQIENVPVTESGSRIRQLFKKFVESTVIQNSLNRAVKYRRKITENLQFRSKFSYIYKAISIIHHYFRYFTENLSSINDSMTVIMHHKIIQLQARFLLIATINSALLDLRKKTKNAIFRLRRT